MHELFLPKQQKRMAECCKICTSSNYGYCLTRSSAHELVLDTLVQEKSPNDPNPNDPRVNFCIPNYPIYRFTSKTSTEYVHV